MKIYRLTWHDKWSLDQYNIGLFAQKHRAMAFAENDARTNLHTKFGNPLEGNRPVEDLKWEGNCLSYLYRSEGRDFWLDTGYVISEEELIE